MKNLIVKLTKTSNGSNVFNSFYTFENLNSINYIDFKNYMQGQLASEFYSTYIVDNFLDTAPIAPGRQPDPNFEDLKFSLVFAHLILNKIDSKDTFWDVFSYNELSYDTPSEQYQRFVKNFVLQGASIFSKEVDPRNDDLHLFDRDPENIFGTVDNIKSIELKISFHENP